ncbi:HigA family addiction module antitoxin [Clostridium sp. Marseille-P299]|uniref:HigA family addiction module antitoxin n=1 Tax=Clostridium sp. Marseille-P299 TaxID=1805477 RepID=UPI0008333EEC|nr:HigA family addiction module antitoxin [Clostridium sp. Marseille-P299]
MSKTEYKTSKAFHPGLYVRNIIDEMEISQTEFAKRIGITDKTLSKLINEQTPLTPSIAQKLATILGTSTSVWINLQANYDTYLADNMIIKDMKEDEEILSFIDYSYFVKNKFVEATKDKIEKITNLRKFFEVSSLGLLAQKEFLVNYRSTSKVEEKNIINANIWMQTALNVAKQIDTDVFNKEKLKTCLPEIRKMTVQSPDEFYPKLHDMLQSCGVALVLLPHLKNSGINGAVRWINKEKVLLAMNDRQKYADIFWFSFCHELRHVLQQKNKLTLINYSNKYIQSIDEELEKDADEFAQKFLIPQEEYSEFLRTRSINRTSILVFAKKINIHPGIVVGRLQHDNKIPIYTHNDLKSQYEIV